MNNRLLKGSRRGGRLPRRWRSRRPFSRAAAAVVAAADMAVAAFGGGGHGGFGGGGMRRWVWWRRHFGGGGMHVGGMGGGGMRFGGMGGARFGGARFVGSPMAAHAAIGPRFAGAPLATRARSARGLLARAGTAGPSSAAMPSSSAIIASTVSPSSVGRSSMPTMPTITTTAAGSRSWTALWMAMGQCVRGQLVVASPYRTIVAIATGWFRSAPERDSLVAIVARSLS